MQPKPLSARNPWILGSLSRDVAAFLAPGVAGFVLSRALAFRPGDLAAQAVLFLVYGLVDSGHVWTTLWRTHAHRAELRERGWRRALPLLVTAACAAWLLSGIPYFWTFAVAATLVHNQRQLWGLVRWYEKLAGARHLGTGVFFRAFVWLPVVAYLTRPLDPGHHYLVAGDIPHFAEPRLFWFVTYVWCAAVLAWGAWETALYFRGEREWARCFGLGSVALLYGWGFFGARSVMDVAFPLVLSHGAAYLALMAQTAPRLGVPGLLTPGRAWGWLLVTACAGGALATLLLERFEFSSWNGGSGRVLVCLASALYFGPTLSHYVADGWLWTGRHREAAAIFRAHSP